MASSATSRGGTRLPHHTARRAGLDPPTRLIEGKPSRKNRPPFHGRKRTTATTLPPPLSSRPFLVTTTTTIGTLPSLSPAPPSLYRRLLLHRSTVISRNEDTRTYGFGSRYPDLRRTRLTYNPLLDLPSLIYISLLVIIRSKIG